MNLNRFVAASLAALLLTLAACAGALDEQTAHADVTIRRLAKPFVEHVVKFLQRTGAKTPSGTP